MFSHLEPWFGLNASPKISVFPNFEPRLALDGGHDGLNFYRYLLEIGSSFLKPNGEMLLELGSFKESELEYIFNKNRIWVSSRFMKDLQGKKRVWNLVKNN